MYFGQWVATRAICVRALYAGIRSNRTGDSLPPWHVWTCVVTYSGNFAIVEHHEPVRGHEETQPEPNHRHVVGGLHARAFLGGLSFDAYCDHLGVSNESLARFREWQRCVEDQQKVAALFGDEYEEFRALEA